MKEKSIKPEKPGGFLDFDPGSFIAREKMLAIINRVFRSFGYNPIETPIVEFSRILTGEDETSKNIFRVNSLSSKKEADLAMRFDHTVPLARFLSANPYNEKQRSGIKLPWRRMVVGPVFRGDAPQKGRYRQFYQFDIDIAGCDLMLADAEIVTVIYETLRALNLDRFVIKLNNRKVLNGLAKLVGITDRGEIKAVDITRGMMRILDKIPKIGLAQALEELCNPPSNEFDPAPSLRDEAIMKIQEYMGITGSNQEKLLKGQRLFAEVPIAIEGLSELSEIIAYLENSGLPPSVVEIDFSIARGLDYYTGPVFETFLLDAPDFGSIFSGGRYNDLVSRFTGQELPAVGASIGVDRLFAALQQTGLLSISNKPVAEILILRLAADQNAYYLQLAEKLRKEGFKVELCLTKDTTFRSQFNFAISQGFDYVVIAGPEEIEQETITVKDLSFHQQTKVPITELIDYFKQRLKPLP